MLNQLSVNSYGESERASLTKLLGLILKAKN